MKTFITTLDCLTSFFAPFFYFVIFIFLQASFAENSLENFSDDALMYHIVLLMFIIYYIITKFTLFNLIILILFNPFFYHIKEIFAQYTLHRNYFNALVLLLSQTIFVILILIIRLIIKHINERKFQSI